MIHTDYAGAARKALLSVLGADAYTRAEALRPSADPYSDSDAVSLGEIHGYRYLKRGGALPVLALPGETDGALRRVSLTRGSGAFSGRDFYRLYRLEAI